MNRSEAPQASHSGSFYNLLVTTDIRSSTLNTSKTTANFVGISKSSNSCIYCTFTESTEEGSEPREHFLGVGLRAIISVTEFL